MNFNEYQARTNDTAIYPKGCIELPDSMDTVEASWMYPALLLSSEQ